MKLSGYETRSEGGVKETKVCSWQQSNIVGPVTLLTEVFIRVIIESVQSVRFILGPSAVRLSRIAVVISPTIDDVMN
jgi:hypothetical protein